MMYYIYVYYTLQVLYYSILYNTILCDNTYIIYSVPWNIINVI